MCLHRVILTHTRSRNEPTAISSSQIIHRVKLTQCVYKSEKKSYQTQATISTNKYNRNLATHIHTHSRARSPTEPIVIECSNHRQLDQCRLKRPVINGSFFSFPLRLEKSSWNQNSVGRPSILGTSRSEGRSWTILIGMSRYTKRYRTLLDTKLYLSVKCLSRTIHSPTTMNNRFSPIA